MSLNNLAAIRAKALALLARREHAYLELKQKLLRTFADEEAIQEVLQQLQQQNLLSEQRYVQNYIANKASKYGMLKIQYELATKVTDTDLIQQIIAEADSNQYEVALKLWQKKAATKEQTPQQIAKQVRFLQSRGFSFDIIRQILAANK